jgi:hypothetical protein
MSTVTQTPGLLKIEIAPGDNFSLALDFSISLAGYTFEAFAGSIPMTVTVVDLAEGKINLSLTAVQTEQLKAQVPRGTTVWFLRWTDTGLAKRTVLRGTITL